MNEIEQEVLRAITDSGIGGTGPEFVGQALESLESLGYLEKRMLGDSPHYYLTETGRAERDRIAEERRRFASENASS